MVDMLKPPRKFKEKELQKSKGIFDDYAIRKSVHTREGTVAKTPVDDVDIANKAYVDSMSGGAPEGTAVLSTGEAGGTKFLREDGDGTSSWQPAAAAHTESSTDSLTNKTIDDFSNKIDADELHIQVRNESGSTITKGDLVYISGYSVGQDVPLVSLADANGEGTFPVLAMINDADIVNNATGHATVFGRVFDIDTSTFNAGDTVYLSNTPGGLSQKPVGTSVVQAVGIILRSHASNGVIELVGAGRVNDLPNIANTKIWIGDINGEPQGFALSGDATMDAGGVITIPNDHAAGTDTALGSGAVAADHGTAATDQIINVCYGTGSPPTANTTTIGTLFVKYIV